MAKAIPTNDIKFVAAILYRVTLASRISHLASRTSNLVPSP